LITGNPGKRRVGKPLPVAPTLPPPPAFLDATAREEWARVSVELFNLHLLTALDVGPLAAYCQTYSRWAAAETALAAMAERDGVAHGLMIRGRKGDPVQNPLVGIARRAAATMMHAAAEFGMTPSARSRIEAGPAPGAGRFDGLLGRDVDGV
jgi:P27 family predicted phage terminase small subunit